MDASFPRSVHFALPCALSCPPSPLSLPWPSFLATTAGRVTSPFAGDEHPPGTPSPPLLLPPRCARPSTPNPIVSYLCSDLLSTPSLSLPLTRSLGLPFLAATIPWAVLPPALRQRRASEREVCAPIPFPSCCAESNSKSLTYTDCIRI